MPTAARIRRAAREHLVDTACEPWIGPADRDARAYPADRHRARSERPHRRPHYKESSLLRRGRFRLDVMGWAGRDRGNRPAGHIPGSRFALPAAWEANAGVKQWQFAEEWKFPGAHSWMMAGQPSKGNPDPS